MMTSSSSCWASFYLPIRAFVMVEECTSTTETQCTTSLEDWIVDSGATSHMTHNEDLLEDSHSVFMQVCLADNQPLDTPLMGNIPLITPSGHPQYLENVLYIPKLSKNVLSISKIAQKGYGLYFDDQVLEIFHKDTHRITAREEGGLYKITSFQEDPDPTSSQLF